MMFMFRSSFITATLVCVFAIISQLATVSAAPQLGMRPNLHVYGVDTPSSQFHSATVSVTVADGASTTVLSPAGATDSAETTQAANDSSSGDTGTEAAVQASAAISTKSGLGAALFVGSIAAVIQIL